VRGIVAGLALVAGWAMLADHVRAQDTPAAPAETVTLDEAVEIALRQNTDLKRAESAARVSGFVTTQERLDFFPNLQLSSSGTRTFGRSFSQEEGGIINETSTFFGTEVNASVDLFNGFEHFASLRRATLEEEASELRLERTRQDVVFLVFDGFTTLQQNRQLAEVRAQELEGQQELLGQVEALVDVGRRPISDLYQQQAAVAEARAAVAEAERLVALTETQLIQVLQLDPTATYTFAAPTLADAETPDLPTYDVVQLLEEAYARRADLDATEAAAAAAREGVRVAQAGYWPVLSLAVGYGSDWSSNALVPVPGTGTDPRTITVTPADGPPATFAVPGSGTDPDFVRPTFLDQLDQRRGGSLRLSLIVPIFDRFQTRTQVAQAEVDALNARYALQDQQQQVALQVRQAVLDYRSARVQLAATTERVQAAERAREAASRRYELGAATFVELTQAITEAVAAQSAQVRARYDVLLAQTLIDYYTGQPDPQRSLVP